MPVGSVSVSVPRERRFIGSQSNNQIHHESMDSIEKGLEREVPPSVELAESLSGFLSKLGYFTDFFCSIYDCSCIVVRCITLSFLNEFSYQNEILGILKQL
jgi:hypothetical protein